MHILMQLFDSMSVWSQASGSEMVMVGYVQWSSIFKPQGNHHRPSMVGTWWYLIVVGSPNKIWIGKGLQIIGLVLRLCICDCDMLLLITMMHILMQLFDSMSVWSQASGSELVMVGYVQWSSIFKPQGNHYRPLMVGTWWYLIVVGNQNKIWFGKRVIDPFGPLWSPLEIMHLFASWCGSLWWWKGLKWYICGVGSK